MELGDIIGRRFGKLVVKSFETITYVSEKNRPRYQYRCLCDCGGEKIVSRNNLLAAHTRACGCLKQRAAAKSPAWAGYGEISGKYWSQIRRHARDRGWDFTISMKEAWEQFELQGGVCALSGRR